MKQGQTMSFFINERWWYERIKLIGAACIFQSLVMSSIPGSLLSPLHSQEQPRHYYKSTSANNNISGNRKEPPSFDSSSISDLTALFAAGTSSRSTSHSGRSDTSFRMGSGFGSSSSDSASNVGQTVHCPICNKAFTGINSNSHMRRHMIIHTGLKPHACPVCPHRSNRAENLRLHCRLKHPNYNLTNI